MNEWIIQDKMILISWSLYLPYNCCVCQHLSHARELDKARMDYWISRNHPRGQEDLQPKSSREVTTSRSQKAKGYEAERIWGVALLQLAIPKRHQNTGNHIYQIQNFWRGGSSDPSSPFCTHFITNKVCVCVGGGPYAVVMQ